MLKELQWFEELVRQIKKCFTEEMAIELID